VAWKNTDTAETSATATKAGAKSALTTSLCPWRTLET